MRELSIAHKRSSLGALPPLQKGFCPDVGQSASERLSSNPPVMFGQVPNIRGELGAFVDWRADGSSSHRCTPPFEVTWEGTYREIVGQNTTPTNNRDLGIIFDTNKANAQYTGTKLQPSALSVLPCIRF